PDDGYSWKRLSHKTFPDPGTTQPAHGQSPVPEPPAPSSLSPDAIQYSAPAFLPVADQSAYSFPVPDPNPSGPQQSTTHKLNPAGLHHNPATDRRTHSHDTVQSHPVVDGQSFSLPPVATPDS